MEPTGCPVRSLTPKGDKEWIRHIGQSVGNSTSTKKASDLTIPTAILITKSGEYILAGRTEPARRPGQAIKVTDLPEDFWVSKFDKNGARLWEKYYPANTSAQVSSKIYIQPSEIILSGLKSGFNTWESAGWIMKLDKKGNKEWDESFRNKSSRKVISSAAHTSDGGFALAGQSDSRAWLIKLDRRSK